MITRILCKLQASFQTNHFYLLFINSISFPTAAFTHKQIRSKSKLNFSTCKFIIRWIGDCDSFGVNNAIN